MTTFADALKKAVSRQPRESTQASIISTAAVAEEKAITPPHRAFAFQWARSKNLYFPDTLLSREAGNQFLDAFFDSPDYTKTALRIRQFKGLCRNGHSRRAEYVTEKEIDAWKGQEGNSDNLTAVIFKLQFDHSEIALGDRRKTYCLIAPSQGYSVRGIGEALRNKLNTAIEETAQKLNAAQSNIIYVALTEPSQNINDWLDDLRTGHDHLDSSESNKPCSEKLIVNALVKMAMTCHELSPLQGEVIAATNLLLLPKTNNHYQTQPCCDICKINKISSAKLLEDAARLPRDQLRRAHHHSPSPVRKASELAQFMGQTGQLLVTFKRYKREVIDLYTLLTTLTSKKIAAPVILHPDVIHMAWLDDQRRITVRLRQRLELIKWITEAMALNPASSRIIGSVVFATADALSATTSGKAIPALHDTLESFLQGIYCIREMSKRFPAIVAFFTPLFQLMTTQTETIEIGKTLKEIQKLYRTLWLRADQFCQEHFLGISSDCYMPENIAAINSLLELCSGTLRETLGITDGDNLPSLSTREATFQLFCDLMEKCQHPHPDIMAVKEVSSLSALEWVHLLDDFQGHMNRYLEENKSSGLAGSASPVGLFGEELKTSDDTPQNNNASSVTEAPPRGASKTVYSSSRIAP